MTTDRSSPHQLALDLAGMMYLGPRHGRLGDRIPGEAGASAARRRPLVVDPPATNRPAERAPLAPAAPATPTEPIAATPAIPTTQPEAPDDAPDPAGEDAPIGREARPLRLAADAHNGGVLEDDVLWSQDAVSPHDVVAPTPRRSRGLTVGEQRRRWARKRSAPAPAAEVDEAPELEQLHDVDVEEAPIAAVVADAPSDDEAEVVAAPVPGVGVRLASSAQGWQRSRARRRLRRQARPAPVKRRKALRGVVVGLVAGALVAVVIAVGLSLGGHTAPDGNSATATPPAAIASSSIPSSTTAATSDADRREHAARAAEAKRERQRRAARQRERRERAARKRREARERGQARELAARRARQRATTPSTPAPAASTPAAPGSAPAPAPAAAPASAAAAAPSSSSWSDRAGWTGEFTP